MIKHAFINVVIPFEPTLAATVNAVLQDLADNKFGNVPRKEIAHKLDETGVVHFMSMTVVDTRCPAESDQPESRRAAIATDAMAHLVLEVSADGGCDEVLKVLSEALEPELERVFEAGCIDLGGTSMAAYLTEKHREISDRWFGTLGQTFTGSPGMTVRRILDEEKLAGRVEELIEKGRNSQIWFISSPRQRLDRIRDTLWDEDHLKWPFIPQPAPLLGAKPNDQRAIRNPQLYKALWAILTTFLWPWFLLSVVAILIVLWLTWPSQDFHLALLWSAWIVAVSVTLAFVVVGAIYWRLRHSEKTDLTDDRMPLSHHVQALMEQENFFAQNNLASVSRLKPGWLRKLTLRLAFIVVGTGRFVCAPGFLGKNGVIHFARWMRLPGTDQLLFFSNYDGTWESYVADFIADAPTGVTAIWSNCVGFPRTDSLFSGGASERDALVRWARRQQHPTRFWYSAYPDLTAVRIRTNAAIRQGLASAQSDADARDWLGLFGSAPTSASALQMPQIPTLAFGGLSNMPYATCYVIAFSADVAKCKRWLTAAAADAAYGETLPGQKSAVVVALSVSGLERLGIPTEAIGTFPVPFQQGMWPKWRARALGDTDQNDPDRWEWGVPDEKDPDRCSRADVLLLVYGLTQPDLDNTWKRLEERAGELGHRVVHSLPLTPLPPKPTAATDLKPATSVLYDSAGGSEAKRRVLPKEPFGFADGVSQPVIRGAPRSNTRGGPNHLVEAGEIVLGYPDNLGRIPLSPSIPDKCDPDHFLPDLGTDPFRQRPEFSRYEGDGWRDLGANGTFLVVRQLRQHVAKFDDWLNKVLDQIQDHRIPAVVASDDERTAVVWGVQAQEAVMAGPLGRARPIPFSEGELSLGSSKRKQVKDAIAAKLMGRWQDGTSLVRHRLTPGGQQDPPALPDNGFLMGAEDGSGLSCPFGAHIRRANPRDTRFPGSKEEIAATNRHRILRVGRTFGRLNPVDPTQFDPAADKGLLFMCLNADIERQFEFIQKTWLLNPNIHGLEGEVDPIIGCGRGKAEKRLTIPTPTGPIQLKDLPDFVQMIGGGYFFLPGRAVLRFLGTRDSEELNAAQVDAITNIEKPAHADR